ncbi:putative carboxylesterase 17 [Vitis vinifera]|uniref:Putative carboxylesterase 17 n=1 Tax=Vitis vinifera TaxID=29760 RepID=A0A438F286_VITVI|nr:putative carboxylesterase 17 [Vitis vinifera]
MSFIGEASAYFKAQRHGLGYHTFLGDFAVASQSIVLSVDYRHAPENRLPIAYDDCYSSLEWLSCQVSSEPWLERADLSRVFLSGDSAGGNIVHNRGEDEKERAGGEAENLALTDWMWKLSLPEGSNRDHYWCNYEMAELSRAEWCRFPPAVVYVAGLDFLKERGVMYAAFLEKNGVEVKLVEAEGEKHVYHMLHPESEATRLLQKQMSEFIHNF